MSEEWRWQFRGPAKRTYEELDEHAQDRITDTLDEIVTDRWRDPDEYLEPLAGVPHANLRIGQIRRGAECDHDEQVLYLHDRTAWRSLQTRQRLSEAPGEQGTRSVPSRTGALLLTTPAN